MASFDICVRGAGIFGLSVAWACVQAGARVVIVDPNGIASGASGGIVGALAPHVPEKWNPKKQFQLESLLLAQDFWADVTKAGGQNPGYARTGRVQPLADDSAIRLARARITGAEKFWLGRATWEIADTAEGWAVQSPTGQFIRDTLSAHIHPKQACNALAAALRARGAVFMPSRDDPECPTLWATGSSGLDGLSAGRPRIMGQGIKGQAALLQLDRRGLPQLFTDTLHIIPHLDGTVAVGSTTERSFDDATQTDDLLEDILDRARAAVPELADAPVLARWAGLRPRARSRVPMLGRWPDRPGHFIANGGFKIGFGMAPKVGQVMAELILEGQDTIPPGFRVEDNF